MRSRSQSAVPSSTRALQPEGRDAEIALVRGLLERASKGAGGALLIEGVGGIGKTKLVQAALELAEQLNIEVYSAGAEQLEENVLLSPIRRALAHLRGQVDDALDGAIDIGSAVDGVIDLLESRALRRPVLLVVEDLHWADAATLSVVRGACRRVADLALAVIGTFRPLRSRPELAHVVDRVSSDGAPVLQLGPLDPSAVERLVRDLIGGDPAPSLLAELGGAAGNPFYVVELIAALRLEGALHVDEGRVELADVPLPTSMRLTIVRRIASLPSMTSEILRTASVLGSTFTADDLGLVVGRAPVDLLSALGPALEAGFIDTVGDRIGFSHELVREAVYTDIPTSVRNAIHRQIARELAQARRPPSMVAAHMTLGAQKGDREAVDWLIQASEDVGRGTIVAIKVGVETGVHTDLLLRGAELCADDDPTRFAILARALLGLTVTYRCAEAEALARRLLDDPALPVDLEPVVRHGLASALTLLGREADAREQWRILTDHVEALPVLRSKAESELAMSAVLSGEVAEAERLAERVLVHADRDDHPWPMCQALMTLGLVASARGRVRDAIERTREAIPFGDLDWELGGGLSGARMFAGLALVDADLIEEAKDQIRVDYGRARRDHLGRSIVEREIGLAAVDYIGGAWDDALVELESALSFEVDERLELFVGLGVLARIHLHRANTAKANEALKRAEQQLESFGPGVGLDLLLWCRALIERDAGRPQAAVELLDLAWQGTAEARYTFGIWRHIWPDLVRVAREAGRVDLVDSVVAAAQHGARAADGLGSVEASARWIAGLASDEPALLATAAADLRATPRVIESARASEDAGVALFGHDRDLAVSDLRYALESYQRLDATADVDRVRARLRDAGVRIGTRGRRRRATVGWESLTSSELRIVSLVAEGLTNAQIAEQLFISRRTVQTHLANVFTKLAASTRAEVAAEAVRRGH